MIWYDLMWHNDCIMYPIMDIWIFHGGLVMVEQCTKTNQPVLSEYCPIFTPCFCHLRQDMPLPDNHVLSMVEAGAILDVGWLLLSVSSRWAGQDTNPQINCQLWLVSLWVGWLQASLGKLFSQGGDIGAISLNLRPSLRWFTLQM